MRRLSCILLLAAVQAASAWATPIAYVEPPDLPGSGGPNFVLDIGTNTITGSVNGCNDCVGDYQDNFSLTLPAGLIVTSGFLDITNFNNGGGANPVLGCFSQAGCFGTGYFSGMSLDPGTTSFTATSPYSALAGSVIVPGSFNYTLSYTAASQVPEPSTVAGVASALIALILIRRRKSVIEIVRGRR